MFTARLFNNRLDLTGGLRRQSSKDDGRQPYNDGSWNFVKYPSGARYVDSVLGTTIHIDTTTSNLYTDTSKSTAAALQARIRAAGLSFPSAAVTNKLDQYLLQYNPNHALHAKTSNPATPMLAAAFHITDRLVFKPSWSRQTSLPNYETTGATGNGTGGLLNTSFKITSSDPVDETKQGGEGGITVANPNLKAQMTDSWEFTLGYYTRNGGSITATYFYKRTKDAWITDTVFVTDPTYASVLTALGLTPEDYPNWGVSTTFNSDQNSLNRGCEFQVIQNLGILGDWASHLDVFGNYSHKYVTQYVNPKVIAFGDSSNDTWAAGIRYGINRFSVSLRSTWQNKLYSKGGAGTTTYPFGGTVTYQNYNVFPAMLKVDLQADYQISKRVDVYIASANFLNTRTVQNLYDMAGIMPSYAYQTKVSKYGTILSVGVKASF
jgi:outer membrane receptor protein involved in Fe transport